MDTHRVQNKGLIYVVSSIVCLLALLSELLILKCEGFIYEKEYFQFTITESIVHWVLVCVVWGFVGSFLIYFTARVKKFDISLNKEKPTLLFLIICIILSVVVVAGKFFVFDGWKILIDFQKSGWFQFIFQLVYYIFEVFMIGLVVAYSQDACEEIVGCKKIPWGGVFLALTWGISHIITQSNLMIGIAYAVYALACGVILLLCKKNIYYFYVFIALMFLL